MAEQHHFDQILIRGTNWIGDSVMSVPALKELRRHHPSARLTLLVRPWVRGLFEGQSLVDEICLEPAGSTPLSRAMLVRRLRQPFDAAILFPNSFGAAVPPFLARVPNRFGYRTDGRAMLLTRKALPRLEGRHQVYYYLDLLFQVGLSPIDYLRDGSFRPDIGLRVTLEQEEEAIRFLRGQGVDPAKKRVILNPGAFFGPAKRWFTERYAELARRLFRETEAVEILVIGSEGETRFAEEIAGLAGVPVCILTGKTDLPTLMALLATCRLFITNDSGPMHLAAALNVPQIALFGSTDETATGPFNPRAHVIHKHVECSPCLLRECPIDLRCFSQISVHEVFDLAVSLLNDS